MIRKLVLAGLWSAFVCFTCPGQVVYPGNGGTSFGGPIGTGSLTLSTDGTNLTGTITRGTLASWNDSLVIYFDTTSGGATTLPTSGEIGDPDYGRRSVVNEFGSGITLFPATFGADFALALAPGNSTDSLYSIPTSGAVNANTLGFVAGANLTNLGNTSASTYTFTISLANLGITPQNGVFSFNFVTTYLNPVSGTGNDATYRSNEGFVNQVVGVGVALNDGYNNATFAGFETFAAVPEPSTLSLLAGSSVLGAWFLLRRRRV